MADATQLRPGVYGYTSDPRELQRQQIDPVVHVEAHVGHGRVETFVLRHREQGRMLTSSETFDFGAVPHIVAPSGPRVETLLCSSAPVSPS